MIIKISAWQMITGIFGVFWLLVKEIWWVLAIIGLILLIETLLPRLLEKLLGKWRDKK